MTAKNGAVTITVAICTRLRHEMLLRALASVCSQSRQPDEILVINNQPDDTALPSKVVSFDPRVRVLTEDREGLDFARNRALGEATGAWLLFVDDDVVLDEAALTRLEARIGGVPASTVINGRVLPLSLDHAGQRLFERNAGFDRGDQLKSFARSGVAPWKHSPIHEVVSVGSGCCMAVERKRALQLGGFDEALDLGPALGGGGDLDMYWRVVQAGERVIYDPAVLAQHEHRREVVDAISQICQHSAGLIVFLTKAARRGPWSDRMMTWLFLTWRLLKPCMRYFRSLIGRDPLGPAQVAALIVATWSALGRYTALQQLAASSPGRTAAQEASSEAQP